MFCSKRTDTYKCLNEINDISIQGNIYLSYLLKSKELEKEIQNIMQKYLETGQKYLLEDVEEITKNILNLLQPLTKDYINNLFHQKGLLKENKEETTLLNFDEKEEEEEENEKEEEETVENKLEILVVEDKNPCCDSIYDTNKAQFEYTFEYPSLIAVRKGVCFKCSTYKSILYSNVNNDTSSQMCEDCISTMFNDFKK